MLEQGLVPTNARQRLQSGNFGGILRAKRVPQVPVLLQAKLHQLRRTPTRCDLANWLIGPDHGNNPPGVVVSAALAVPTWIMWVDAAWPTVANRAREVSS